MTALQAYRDDGPLAAWIVRKLAAAGSRPGRAHPLAWVVPPLVRLVEYGSLIALTAVADPDALPLCFAFLGVLAFHHYDTVYRLRHQRVAPPSWVRAAGAGWEGRLLVALVLALGGVLRLGFLAAAIGLVLLYAAESAFSWIRFGRVERPPALDGEDLD